MGRVTSSKPTLSLVPSVLWFLQQQPYLLMCHIKDTCQGYQLARQKQQKFPHSKSSSHSSDIAPWGFRIRWVKLCSCPVFMPEAKIGKLELT